MKNKLSYIAALWWVILCAVAGLFLLLMADKQSRPSDFENRMLAGFPDAGIHSVTSGEFMEGFDAFLSDGFFDRDGVVSFTNGLIGRLSTLSEDESRAAQADEMELQLASEEGSSAAPQASSPEPAPVAVAAVIADDEGSLQEEEEPEDPDDMEESDVEGDIPINEEHSYLWLKKADGGNKIIYKYDRDRIETYAETLRIMQGYLPDDGVICFTQVPLSSIANRWIEQPRTYRGWGSSVENMLEDCLAGDERIYVFNTFEILEPYMQEGLPAFYHTDHHWSAEGAYIVAAEMLKRQNLPVIPYEEYDYTPIKSRRNSRGYVDTFNVLTPLLPGHSYILTRINEVEEIPLMNYKTVTYGVFMNNSRRPWRRIVTGANTGRKALVICDSFGNAFTPYLLPYYDEVHMTDFRYSYYSKEEAGGSIGYLMQYHGISDVYIITSTANGLRKDNSILYLRQYLMD